MKIEILYFEECPHHHAAEELIRNVLSELGKAAQLTRIAIPDEGTAVAERFPGSPTIRIDGVDIEPIADTGQYGLRCRVYSTPTGLSGTPARQILRAKIQAGDR